jgi:hypothetical protein
MAAFRCGPEGQSQIHRGLDVQRTSTRKAKVQARSRYTRFKLDETKDLADELMQGGLRELIANSAIWIVLDVARFPTPKST